MCPEDNPLVWLHGEVKTPPFSARPQAERQSALSTPVNEESPAMIPEVVTMNRDKREKLEAKGWKVGDTADFLSLSPDEAAYVEMKIAFSQNLRARRRERRLTQGQLARMIQSSQSRVAKMEAGDPSVSLDLLVRSLLALGTSKHELARVISAGPALTR